MTLSRRTILFLPLLAAACAGRPPVQAVPRALKGYDYLPRFGLNVATLDVDDQAAAQSRQDIAGLMPTSPAQALARMASTRLLPVGSTGRAVFVIQDASITRTRTGLAGLLRVRLDILTGNGLPVAFAQAQVTRVLAGDTIDLRASAYELTRQMMDDMNVELEYQLRRSLSTWLVPA